MMMEDANGQHDHQFHAPTKNHQLLLLASDHGVRHTTPGLVGPTDYPNVSHYNSTRHGLRLPNEEFLASCQTNVSVKSAQLNGNARSIHCLFCLPYK
jgi:hypothetical protein